MDNLLYLTNQETNIIKFLTQLNRDVAWEELAQFAKDPQTVKLKTIKKAVSDLKRKYILADTLFPYSYKFYNMSDTIMSSPQKLVQVKSTVGGNVMLSNSNTYACQTDFRLNKNTKSVISSHGSFRLNDNEWDVFKYFHSNPERIVSLSELRDKVVFPQFGSKLPARWFSSITRIVQNLRRQVPTLKSRLVTITGLDETSYIFK